MGWAALALAAVSPAVTLLIALWGFQRTTRADRLKMFLDLQERYLSEPARGGRQLIHQRLPGLDASSYGSLDDDERSHIHHALAIMNTIAIACESRHIDYVMVVRTMGRSFASAIAAARPYIEHQAVARGYPPYQYAVRVADRIAAGLPRAPGR
jgi:hypothetical protein